MTRQLTNVWAALLGFIAGILLLLAWLLFTTAPAWMLNAASGTWV